MHPVAVMAAEDMSVNRTNVEAFDSAMRAASSSGADKWVKRVSDTFQELTTGLSSLPPPKVWFDQVAQAAESAAVKVQVAFRRSESSRKRNCRRQPEKRGKPTTSLPVLLPPPRWTSSAPGAYDRSADCGWRQATLRRPSPSTRR